MSSSLGETGPDRAGMPGSAADPYVVTGLAAVMATNRGSPGTVIGLLDTPVATDHPALASATLRRLGPGGAGEPDQAGDHGTAVAGMLVGAPGAWGAGICPDVTVLVLPVLPASGRSPVSPLRLADAIVESVAAGARIINISAASTGMSSVGQAEITLAVQSAARAGAIVVAAAGNDGRLGGPSLLANPWVIPVVATDQRGTPLGFSHLGRSGGRYGLAAPGLGVTSLTASGGYGLFGGTSAAAPMVTGAIALAWSAAPTATAAQVRRAVTRHATRSGVVPPVLNAPQLYRDVVSMTEK